MRENFAPGPETAHALQHATGMMTPRRTPDPKSPDGRRDSAGTADQPTGISNRATAREEADDRREHPPVDTGPPPPEDAAGRIGELPVEDISGRQTSHKAGSRSIAQKTEEARYADRPEPSARKVKGAFGKEPTT